MALRALLFSSDGSATALICEILTDLHIEAEICTEVLVAAERIGRENYDAILVDWQQEAEAGILLKAAREKKAGQALNLALVKDDKEVARALQMGANSVIRKPIDVRQAEDTLSTARDLILSRRAEQQDKADRAAVARAEVNAAAAAEPIHDEAPAPKTGFLSQTAPRSAFEAEAQTAKAESSHEEPSGWRAARGPDVLQAEREQVQEIRPPEKKRWDESKPLAKVFQNADDSQNKADESAHAPHSDDSTGVFSSLAEQPEESEESADATDEEATQKSHSPRLGFVLIACMLIAGVLYVWAPGDSYGGRLSSIWHLLPFAGNSTSPTTASAPAQEKPATPDPAPKADDPPADDGPIATTEVDPSRIKIIETKTIPKTGAQVPPSDTPPAGSDQAQASAQPAAQPETSSGATPQPPDQNAPLAVPTPTPPPVEAPPTAPNPALVTISQPRPSMPLPGKETPPTVIEGRSGVIIPDSLKNSPSSAPGSSLEASAVPEETSRALIVRKIDPDYPTQALPQKLEGPVTLQVRVAKDGSVQDVKLMKGYILLGRAAVDAVRQWHFKPYAPNGKAIDFQTSVTLNFKIPR
jgi:TonB family protein